MDKKKRTVEEILLSEAMDSSTLEDKAEKEELLIENEYDKVSEMVKNSYKKLTAGHAIVRQRFAVIYAIVLGMFYLCGLITIIFYGIIYRDSEGSYIAVICGGIVPIIIAIVMTIVVYHDCYKLFDAYFCKCKGKRIIFYVNRKYSILYKSRKDYVCINNITGQKTKYTLEDFMNVKMGFNHLIGKMVATKRKNGYKIKTKEFKRFSVSQFSGNSTLWTNDDLTPKKILIGDSDIYEFKTINDSFAENSTEIKMLLDKFKTYL